MTNLAYARMILNDTDSSNQIFSDSELEQLISQNSELKVVPAAPKNLANTVWQIPYRMLDSSYEAVIYDEYQTEYDATIDYEDGTATLTATPDYPVFMECKIIHWNDVKADGLEMIATDIRRWNSYSDTGLSEQFDKASLLAYSRSIRSARGVEL